MELRVTVTVWICGAYLVRKQGAGAPGVGLGQGVTFAAGALFAFGALASLRGALARAFALELSRRESRFARGVRVRRPVGEPTASGDAPRPANGLRRGIPVPNLRSVGYGGSERRRRRAWVALLSCAAVALIATASASADDVGDFTGSWTDQALSLQYGLGSDMPLRNAPYIGTHNSFNSIAEMGDSLTAQGSNQKLDLVDQLNVDVRSLELDLHRIPTANGLGFKAVVCHANGGTCTVEKKLGPALGEISGWLRDPDNSDQVLLLYLEDDLDTQEIHNQAADAIERKLGDLVYRPPGGGCTEVSPDVTRDQILDAGKQVLIVSGCGKGAAWQSYAYSWEDHRESRPFGFEDYPSCGPDYDIAEYDFRLIRYFEDSTRVASGSADADNGITPATAAAMARCGVDLVSLDQLEPLDGRLESLVWSWAPQQPADGRCAVVKTGAKFPFGRWFAKTCSSVKRPPACRRGEQWIVPRGSVDPLEAAEACREHRAVFAVPRTGYENELLRDAMSSRGASSALLGYKLHHGTWTALDKRDEPATKPPRWSNGR